MSRLFLIGLLFLLISIPPMGCHGDSNPVPAGHGQPGREYYTEEREPCADYDPLRNVYFGDLHAHSGLSYDAWAWDVHSTQDDAYRFAQGEPIKIPPLDENGVGTRTIRLERPLDFVAMTDHSETLAEVQACTNPDSEADGSLFCLLYRNGHDEAWFALTWSLIVWNPKRDPAICGPGRADCPALVEKVWKRIQQAAEDAYDRSERCSFTSFIAYEWSATPGASNIHRNVIFRNAHVPERPVSYFEEQTPQGLWADLKRTCLDAGSGCDVITIPHNSNLSNGHMFNVEYPGAAGIDEERVQAAFRSRMEPLVEMFQGKGGSECMNGLSGILGEPDELCDFEKVKGPCFDDCGDGTGLGGMGGSGCVSRLDFVRNALLAGLQEEERLGVNPYRFGFCGSTDTHNAAPGSVVESDFAGHHGRTDATPETRISRAAVGPLGIVANPGGLAAVWAEENSRDAIFEAFRRREVYGTSGPRMVVRFFGGWSYPDTLCENPRFLEVAYDEGVPMGGDLPARPQGSASPRFAVHAIREADFGESEGTLLQRVQIIKGWIDDEGRMNSKVFEVAGDPDKGATVDLDTCRAVGEGFDRLCTVWSDPEFDPRQSAYYYARVVENPTCRWHTRQCLDLPPEERPAACDDPGVPKVIQERAWTSPIWYQPDGSS